MSPGLITVQYKVGMAPAVIRYFGINSLFLQHLKTFPIEYCVAISEEVETTEEFKLMCLLHV